MSFSLLSHSLLQPMPGGTTLLNGVRFSFLEASPQQNCAIRIARALSWSITLRFATTQTGKKRTGDHPEVDIRLDLGESDASRHGQRRGAVDRNLQRLHS